MFFENFWRWLDAQLAAYIGTQTATLAGVLEPAIVALGTLYVMVWGALHLSGRIEEPVVDGIKRILTLAIVLGVSVRLWLYNDVIVDTFWRAPSQLAAALVGAPLPMATLDEVWNQGGAVAGELWARGAVLTGDLGFYAAGAFVWLLVGGLCVYALFLMALSQVALSILLALGPLFIALWFFEATRRFVELWFAQLANYALITVLTVLVAALILQIVRAYAVQTAALGAAILTVDALNLLLVTGLALLVLRQVMPMASGLARGVALSGFHVASQAMQRVWRGGSQAGSAAVGRAVASWRSSAAPAPSVPSARSARYATPVWRR
jgi:type IV secretion system protein VirB6